MITSSTSYSAGAVSAGCNRLETFSLFFLLLVIGPPANPSALNLASAAIAIVVSYTQITEEFCDRRGISSHLWGWDGWPHQPLLGGRCAPEPLTMCLTASTRDAYLVIQLAVFQPVERPGPLAPQRDLKVTRGTGLQTRRNLLRSPCCLCTH